MVYLSKEEIVRDLVSSLSCNERDSLKALKKEDMVQFHRTTGMWIRNHYGLWEKENPLTQLWHFACENHDLTYILSGVDTHPNHPDAVSGEILKMVWSEVHNPPSPDLLSLVDKQ